MPRLRRWVRWYWSLLVLSLGLIGVVLLVFSEFQIDVSTFLAILIPASVGVLGTYGIHLKRRAEETRRLRKALRSELNGMTWFETWPDEGWSVPAFDPVPRSVYQRNANNLGLLSDQEITHIVEFYSLAEVVQDVLGYHRDMSIQSESLVGGPDVNKKDRAESIVTILDKMALSHVRALYTVQQKIGDPAQRFSRVHEGDILGEEHPLLKRARTLFVEYGIVDEQDGGCRVTSTGHGYLSGELSTRELEKERDILGRDKAWYENIWDWATSLR